MGNGLGAFSLPNMEDSRERRRHFLRSVVAMLTYSFEVLSTHLTLTVWTVERRTARLYDSSDGGSTIIGQARISFLAVDMERVAEVT